ncbi:MAG: V-type ATP synthase subunit D [Salaquimonas sp.]|jgi:V/A-type H+-transporting ATPase subunit D|nr:V-type ATP synthase subunit D [Salaquimonas sp.]
MADYPATRATAIALGEEERLIRQGYDFLDEKRMLLAGEIMRQLDDWKRLREAYGAAMASAREALGAAIIDHGLEELQVHPPVGEGVDLAEVRRSDFLGVRLVHVAAQEETGKKVALESDSVVRCASAFRALIPLAQRMAAASGNLHRLADEYARTERRASALENVLLPEIANALKTIDEQLEEVDLEEAVRVRLAGRRIG